MVCMEMLFKYAFWLSAALAGVIISFPHFITEEFPSQATMVRNTSAPIRVFITPVFSATKFIIALTRTKVMLLVFLFIAIIHTNRFATNITRHYREFWVVIIYITEFMRFGSPKMFSVTGTRTALSNFSLFAVGNKFSTTYPAYQLYHSYIIAQYTPFNAGEDYRPLKEVEK